MLRSALFGLGMLAALTGCGGDIPAEALTQTSLSGKPEEQEKAVLELGRRGPSAIPQLRLVAAESKIPLVRAAAIQALGAYNDAESATLFFAAMEDADPLVRGRAGAAATNIIGADYFFRANDPEPKRRAILRAMKASYEKMLKHGAFERRGSAP